MGCERVDREGEGGGRVIVEGQEFIVYSGLADPAEFNAHKQIRRERHAERKGGRSKRRKLAQ